MKKFNKYLMITLLLLIMVMGCQTISAATEDAPEKYVVVIDPGHGGIDVGAECEYNGKTYKEADLVWKISVYLKRELAKYPNIEVKLTRGANNCPGLANRVEMAAVRNADLLVSIHLNSYTNTNIKGACVLVSKGTYRSYLAEQEKIFANFVMDELNGLGLSTYSSYTGGLYYRLSQTGEKYPNGGAKDYYQIVNNSVMKNLPGVIIEHAFMTNPSDFKNFLSTNSKLQQLAQADARAIVKYFSQVAATEKSTESSKKGYTGWVKKYDKYFYYKNGTAVTDSLLRINGYYYYFDGEGVRQTGWITYNNKTYYARSNGRCLQGYCRIGSKYYYFHKTKGYLYKNVLIKLADNTRIYAQNNGVVYTNGLKKINGYTFYFNKNGKACRGWKEIDGKWYYFHKSTCRMLVNKTLRDSKGNSYVFDSKGICIKGRE